MTINFIFPELPHPSSPEISIADLANILESKYQVIETFEKQIRKEFIKKAKKDFERRKRLNPQSLQEWLKNEWRDYIISGKAGFTVASQKRGDPAFIDTSAYYLGCQPSFVFTEKEKKKYL